MGATVCLNMIVKNEAHVIRRCLASARPLIDHWVIVDTGSTDGTQQIIREFLADIPGTLHERPWKNFGHNRNEALDLARDKADYVLMIDADETFIVPDGFEWPELTADCYRLQVEYGEMVYDRAAMVAMKQPWWWEGVLHEYLETRGAHTTDRLEAPRVFVRHDGARAHDPTTYDRDSALLEQALIDDPNNTRYQFYLAQSYRDAGKLEKAKDAYLKRATMGGWDEEVWYSLFQAVAMLEAMGAADDEVISGYMKVWEQRPHRIEPLHALARYLRVLGRYEMAAMIARRGMLQPMPTDILFVDASVYRWRMKDEFSVATSYLPDQRADGHRALKEILRERHYHPSEEARLLINQKFFESVLPPPAESERPIALDRKGAFGDILMTLNLLPAVKARWPGRPIHYYCAAGYGKVLRPVLLAAGVDDVRDCEDLHGDYAARRVGPCLSLQGYPTDEGYPERPMPRHLLASFARDIGLTDLAEQMPTLAQLHMAVEQRQPAALPSELPSLVIPEPPRLADLPARYVTLHTQAGWSPYKNWSPLRWGEVVQALRAQGIAVVQIGGASDAAIDGVSLRVNDRPMVDQIAALAHAQAHLGIDSWPNHLTHWLWQRADGSTRRVPGVILWGATQAAAAGYPSNINLSAATVCQPCFREDPKFSQHDRGACTHPATISLEALQQGLPSSHPRANPQSHATPGFAWPDCMDGISTDDVLQAVGGLLGVRLRGVAQEEGQTA